MFVDGDFTDEVSFNLYYDDGANGVFIGGHGAERTLTFMSINNGDGDILFGDLWGADADDTDPNITAN